jgi:hypothetical protein
MARSPRESGINQSRAVAAYLVALRPILGHATQTRQSWVKKIGLLMADTRLGNPQLIAQQAGQIGRENGASFQDAQRALERLKPPMECSECHVTLSNWLAKLVQSCDVLVEIGRTGDLKRMKETQRLLTEGRGYAQAFNDEYARLCQVLREHVSAVKARQGVGGAAVAARSAAARPRR